MLKVWNAIVADEEIEKMEKTLVRLGSDIVDYDKTKKFELYGMDVIVYTIICTDKTIEKINKMCGTHTLYEF